MTQAELGRALWETLPERSAQLRISRLEHGRRPLEIDEARAIARALGLSSLDELVGDL